MPRRPPSSAGGERPFTSGGFRPSTAQQPHAGLAGFDRDPQYTYSLDEEEEEEEESDAEDLFAFLPPNTAEQQQQYQAHTDSQLHEQHPQQGPLDHGAGLETYEPDFGGGGFAAHLDYDAMTPPLVTPPPLTYDPYARYPADATMGPSSVNAVNSPITPHFQMQSPTSASAFMTGHTPMAVVESPPSTDSQQHGVDDPYQMRRVRPTTAHTGSTEATRASGVSSREVRISLPPGSPTEKSLEEGYGLRPAHKRRSSTMDTMSGMSMTPSMIEEEGSVKMEFDFDAIDEEDSPYPEVRASVSNIDDPDMPCLTVRMWFIGLLLCMCSSAMNVFFNFRYPAPTVVPITLLLISYPFGKFLAYTLPITTYRLPKWLGCKEFSFNPGPWNIKEHVLVFIMANVAVSPPYAMNAIVVSEIYYHLHLGFWFNLVLVLATQITGFGLAGLCRRFLVWPASMVWPQNLVACTLLNTLHAEDDEGAGGLTRFKYYMYVSGGAFFFYFLPGYLFQALSVFSFVCWIVPNNVPVNQLFGVSSGLGMSVLTFDWNQVTWIGSPLMIPWWAEVHIIAGFILFYWILVPVLYYSNVWELAHFPISANEPYDRFGKLYNITGIVLPNESLNVTAYDAYSPLYLPATYVMTYLLAFTISTCVLVHTILYHGRSLLNGLKRMKVEPDDIHAKLMKNYLEVPDWWYGITFLVTFSLGIVAVEVWHTGIPVWLLLIAVILPVVYILPSGFVFAMTGQSIGVNLLAQVIPGSLVPGNPLANMVFKAYSVQTLVEASSFTQDLKLGHYIKVPPRATFTVQAVSTFLAALVSIGVKTWMFNNIHDICSEFQKDSLTCPHNQVFYTASIVWGLIGPTRQFGPGTLYHPQIYALIIGAFLPIPFWLWQRRYPSSWIKFFSTPVLLNGVAYIPPATGINYSSWFAVGFVFQYLIRRRNFAWWSKFNYVTSAAMDSGTVISLIAIFFVLEFPKGGVHVNWWGNNVYKNTTDWTRAPWKPIGPQGLPLR